MSSYITQQRVPMPFNKNKEGENVHCIWAFVGIANEYKCTRQGRKQGPLKKREGDGSEIKKTTYFPSLAHSQ